MKIAFLNIYQGQVERGAETYVAELSKRLARSHTVDVIGGHQSAKKRWAVLWRLYLDPHGLQTFWQTAKILPKILKGKYDIIVIDGEFRDECSKLAPRYLKKGGIIILDNSDWHRNIAKNFRELGFLQIDFKGFGALNTYTWVTSIFYKNTFNFRGVSEQLPTNPIGFIDPKNFK